MPPNGKITEFVAILAGQWSDADEAFDESPWAAATRSARPADHSVVDLVLEP
jgi:hypothetical protein